MFQTEKSNNDIFESILPQVKDVNNYPITAEEFRFVFIQFIEKGQSFLQVMIKNQLLKNTQLTLHCNLIKYREILKMMYSLTENGCTKFVFAGTAVHGLCHASQEWDYEWHGHQPHFAVHLLATTHMRSIPRPSLDQQPGESRRLWYISHSFRQSLQWRG